ncbi:MAG: XdhC family protein [Opitutaceae bacterium]|nr:XdhC family protein [Opitutaceae bacterium]
MRTLWPQLSSWIDGAESFALATVTAVSGSAPRLPGACMTIAPGSLRFLGSVSSGCLDVEVVEAARATLASGEPQMLRFGPDGQPPWTDGLTCGGWIAVRVEPWWGSQSRVEPRAIVPHLRGWLERDESAVILSRDDCHLALTPDGAAFGDSAAFSTEETHTALARLAADLPPALAGTDAEAVFVRTIRRRPRLFIVGATDVAARLLSCAREAGFATVVIDPRAAYADESRFSTRPDRLARIWPQGVIQELRPGPRDAAVAVTHDPKIDDVALLALLRTPCGYVGAMGSTRSHAHRLERLRDQGAADADLARIHGPAGIHLATPHAAGIAVGILAGILKWQAEDERRRAAITL